MPLVLVSLIDTNRQWFKSSAWHCHVPGGGTTPPRETPRDISFCGHSILGDNIFLISDASKDERFADNPLVLDEPNIRFYAGCPLRALNGSKLGTLCIIDQKPRTLSGAELETLEDLASMVECELAAVQLATQDELTNITNRRGFMLLAQQSLNFCAREQIPASLVFLDLNKFKQINDRFGHAEGDKVLKLFANLMRHTFRDSDLCARLGGDEFVVFLSKTTEKLAAEVIERFRRSIERYNQEANRGYNISFSYGIIENRQDQHLSIEELLAAGDALMYNCKQQEHLRGNQRSFSPHKTLKYFFPGFNLVSKAQHYPFEGISH